MVTVESVWSVLTMLPTSLHYSTDCIDPLPVASSVGETSLQPVPVMCNARFCAAPVAMGNDLCCTSSALVEATVSVLRLSQRGKQSSQPVSWWSRIPRPVIHWWFCLKGSVTSCMFIDVEKGLRCRLDPLHVRASDALVPKAIWLEIL